MRVTCFLYFILISIRLSAEGVWYKAPFDFNHLVEGSPFAPDFFLVKFGIFSRMGALKVIPDQKVLDVLCKSGRTPLAWITHRLSRLETLMPESGKKLGKQIAASLTNTCMTEVELDIEPIPTPPSWLNPFLISVRKEMGPGTKLRLAIPFVTETNLKGFHWSRDKALEVLSAVDGFDIMNYDSGIDTEAPYRKLILEGLEFAAAVLKGSRDKSIIFGLPAYYDKTQLHHISVENLRVSLDTFRKTKEAKATLCDKRFRIAYYASWTMTQTDMKRASEFKDWKKVYCE